ncbi:hypothetical protein C8J57DRAFT_693547 [Mycena rebaudengoi]|nr:hypothetical protein C8J57DRAFT_693547 [Mycena rebaudengoi]
MTRGSPLRTCAPSPGFHFMLARSFKYVFGISEEARETLFRHLCGFLEDMMSPNTSAFKEFVDGVGGLDDLALLIVRFMSYVLETRKAPLSERDIHFLRTILLFVGYADHQDFPSDREVSGALSPFCTALRAHDTIPVLAIAAYALGETPGAVAGRVLEKYLQVLLWMFVDKTGRHWIASAVENELLRAIVSSSLLHVEEDICRHVDLLIAITAGALVYYRIADAIDGALRRLGALASTAAFKESRVYQVWQQFGHLAQEHKRIVDGSAPLKACDNLECSRIAEKAAFRRCSAC